MEFVEEAPKENRLAAVDDLAARDKAIITTNAELSETLGRLKDECRREIRSIIGPEKLAVYEKFHEKKMLRLEDLASASEHTTEAMNLEAKARRRLLTEAQKFLRSSDVDARRIEDIQKKYVAEAQSSVERALRGLEEAPYVDTTDAEAPSPSHNPWAWRSPPHSSQWGTQWSYGTGGWRSVSHFESRITGEVDCWSAQAISGADDSDVSYTTAFSELQFWFQMPAAGLVEVWLFLQAIDTPYGGCLQDEWGFSDAGIQERSRPYLWILSPFGSPRYGTLLDYSRERSKDAGRPPSLLPASSDMRTSSRSTPTALASGFFAAWESTTTTTSG